MKPFIHMNDIRPSENEFARHGTLSDVLDTCLNTDILKVGDGRRVGRLRAREKGEKA